MNIFNNYFVHQGKFGEPNMIYFMSNWATSFSLKRHELTKKACKKNAIAALTNLRDKINAAIEEIEGETK